MIETDKQRRWWFATHPEFGSGVTGQKKSKLEEEKDSERIRPEAVDAYVDERLKYERNEVVIAMLEAMKRWGGTAGQNPESYAELGLEWPGQSGRTSGSNSQVAPRRIMLSGAMTPDDYMRDVSRIPIV
ncbi:MAG TPA: hypothetical protein VK463_09470 [Desulfomonilaceae bacterium]|nr:hypothetical protein [Desulfomonilaceae bacterium]